MVARTRMLLNPTPVVAPDRVTGEHGRVVSRESEPTLLERIARGDGAAVQPLLDRYGPLLWSMAKKQLDPTTAEDAVQAVFVKLWKNADRFDPEKGSETTFVTVIARRTFIDQRRRLGARPETDTLESMDEELSEERDVSAPLETADEARVALNAIEKLAPTQRGLLRMSIVEGKTHREIAALTSLPLGTVKSHLRRGLERVRALLDVQRPEGAQ